MFKASIFSLSILASFLALAPLTAQTPLTPAASFDRLRTSSTLDREGLQPWHLRISFQLYTLEGKPQETGTIEEWWLSPHRAHIVATSPSLSAAHEGHVSRESFLASALLDQFVHPLFAFPADAKNVTISRQDRKLGKVDLECYIAAHPEPHSDATFCVNKDSYDLRLALESTYFSEIRNHSARFLNTQLAMDETLSYNNITAITGHIETLETFDPANYPGPPEPPTPAPPAGATRIPGGVLAGRIAKKPLPDYPLSAKMSHLAGTVLLHALITKEGTIRDIAVIASPDQSLSDSATDAVKRWVYLPYLLNGEPTEVDTTITVNFNLSSH